MKGASNMPSPGEKTYVLHTHLNTPYEQAIERVTEALKAEGFGVLTEIDVQQTLKKKLDADFRRYVILGACNPPLAHRALQTELEVGLLLPCNVVIYEQDGGSEVLIGHPMVMMMNVSGNPSLEPTAHEAQERLQRVCEALSS
jgi:uncharacterized protein (DUF302 family)